MIGGGCKKADKLGIVENLSEIVKNLSMFDEEINSLIFKAIICLFFL